MPIYVKLFNIILETGNIPEVWTTGIIRPIYKNKGSPQDCNNYRPITILSHLGKLFTSLLNNRLNKYLEENTILEENQAGFRAKYATTDHIFVLYKLIDLLRAKTKLLLRRFLLCI